MKTQTKKKNENENRAETIVNILMHYTGNINYADRTSGCVDVCWMMT